MHSGFCFVTVLCAALMGTAQPAGTVSQTLELPAPGTIEIASGGIPCPRGTIQPSAVMVAVAADGGKLPTQCEPVAFWPDGSVKWMFVTALVPADVEDVYLQPAGGGAQTQEARRGTDGAARVRSGTDGAASQVSPAQSAASLADGDAQAREKSSSAPSGNDGPVVTVRQVDGGYEVDTGRLRFRVGRDTRGFIDDAYLWTADGEVRLLRFEGAGEGEGLPRSDGSAAPGGTEDGSRTSVGPASGGPASQRGKRAHQQVERLWQVDYFVADEPGRSPTDAILPAGTLDSSQLVIDSVEVERAGPVQATILLRGHYLYDKVGRSFPGRGSVPSQATIRIHAWAGLGYVVADHTFVYEGNPQTDFLARCGIRLPLNLTGDKGDRITAAAGQDRVERWMYANPLMATDPPDRPNPGGASPRWRAGGIVQDAYDHYRTYKLADATGRPVTVDQASRCGGWLDLSDANWGCAVGIVDMAENVPTGLEASNADATITAWLYPPQVAPADLRRYSPIFGTGEAEPHPGKATGLARTHRLWFYFHEGRDEIARVAEVADNLSGIRLLKADPALVASSGVLGPFRESQPQRFPKLEGLARDVTEFMLTHQRYYRWFGIFDYGDFQSVYRYSAGNGVDNCRWMNDWGRWGWVNDEGLITYWLLWQYLRTGDADAFKAGSAMAAHVRDVDVKHTRAYPLGSDPDHYEYVDLRGFGHRHNVNHWGDAYIGPRVANPIAWRLHYYLTGDGRTRDAIDEVYQANVARGGVWGGSDSMPTALYALYAKYEMTGDMRYRAKIEAFLDAYCDYAIKHRQFPNDTPWDFVGDKPAGPFKGDSAGSFFWHSFGMANFLVEWYALTDDAKLREALTWQAYATLAQKGWSSAYCHFQMLSTGYRLTGDSAFRKRMAELLAPLVSDERPVPADRDDWLGPNAYVRPKTVSMIGFFMSGLPYVEGAVPNEKALWPEGSPAPSADRQ